MDQKIRVGIKVQITGSTQLSELALHLGELTADPRVMAALLRKAAAETILEAWRQRFYAALPSLLNMTLADAQKAAAHFPDSLKNSLIHLHSQLERAVREGYQTESRKIQDQVKAKEDALQQALLHAQGGSDLATGRFRELAIAIINLMTEVDTIGMAISSDSVMLGIGPLNRLNAIETPSATPKLSGHPTSSAMTTMWRQLEFGTGIYASGDPSGNPGSPFKEGDGSWWYGKKRGMGLHLLGTPGAHVAYDMDGVPYEPDALRFQTVFAGLFFQAIKP
jgi:hypothetical protein